MKSFVINHHRYEESTVFSVTTPELGTLNARVDIVQEMATPGATGLRLGPIATPLPCRAPNDPQANAYLHLYAAGTGDYISLQVVYTCTCRYDYHNHALEWQVKVDGTSIVATEVGTWFRQPHTHPMAPGFEQLAPAPYVPEPAPVVEIPYKNLAKAVEPVTAEQPVANQLQPVEKLPDPNRNRHGQFSLF